MLGFLKLDFMRFPEDPFEDFGRCKQPGKGGMIDKVPFVVAFLFISERICLEVQYRFPNISLVNIVFQYSLIV